jgi:Peptidase_C39 like family
MSNLSPAWYKRWRVMVSFGFLCMIALTLFVQTSLADNTLQMLGQSLILLSSEATGIERNTAAQTVPANLNASQRLVRISQLDPAQYSSTSEYNLWAYSACSAASMTEVFDAYGGHLRITDVLQVEANIGEITPSQGLLRPEGIANTAAQLGFKTNWGNSWSLDAVIATADQGHPVIVSFPPDSYDGGHLLVVTGGDSNYVYLADSSLWNRRVLSRGQFLAWWEGFAAVVTPK